MPTPGECRILIGDFLKVAIYHDGGYGNVYISQNEGKSWVRRSDIPEGEAKSFVKHPFDNNYVRHSSSSHATVSCSYKSQAFVLSKGKKHWRTADRVKTWHSFKMPLAPAITATPLSFHSDKKNYKYILYQGTECTFIPGWPETCVDTVRQTNSLERHTLTATTDILHPRRLLYQTKRSPSEHLPLPIRTQHPQLQTDVHSNLIYCVASPPSNDFLERFVRRLYSSADFFDKETKIEDLGIGEKQARGVVSHHRIQIRRRQPQRRNIGQRRRTFTLHLR